MGYPSFMFVLAIEINGELVQRAIPDNRSLLDFLRQDLELTGSKHGCDLGDCGACTVMMNGQPRLACITLAATAAGASVTTIEGLGDSRGLHPVQAALHRHVAAQCGYCTPGIAVRLAILLADDPAPDDDAIRTALGANICRCTGYTKILAAARDAITQMQAVKS
jgi:carbon-monoxide dehydrogenase small subunit